MNPTTIAELLERHGGWGLSALLLVALVAQWWENRRALAAAHAAEVAALRQCLPLAEKLAMGVVMVERKQKRTLPVLPP